MPLSVQKFLSYDSSRSSDSFISLQRVVLGAQVLVLLIRAAVTAVNLAAIAAPMGPTKATGCRYLGAARGVADMATAVGPAVAVAFGLASTARYLAELGAAVMEAAVVQPSTVRAIRIETAVRGQSFFAQIKDSRPRMFFPWW